MKILYVASDQCVPGATGGSVHVLEVARGLATLGHEVHAIVWREGGQAEQETRDGVVWHRIRWLPPHRFFRFRARPAVEALARIVKTEAVIERYYNFGGEGVRTARRLSVPALLEMNSPAVDEGRSLKSVLDALLVVRPMRRYRESLCRDATALIAPIPQIVPLFAQSKTEIVTWGANVDMFRPEARDEALRRSWGASPSTTVVLFSGSFRPWHGVHLFEDAARRLKHRGDIRFVLVGGGRRGPGRGFPGEYLGTLPYERMASVVASCDVGVAPYDPSQLSQLRLGFYWSPLKIFEYMACGLPTITIPREPLTEIVGEQREGIFFEEGDVAALCRAIVILADDATLRRGLGASARRRVVERYSWARHCQQLDALLRRMAGR